MFEKAVAIGIVAAVIVILTLGLMWRHERSRADDLSERLKTAQQQLQAAKVNREVLNQLDRDQREVRGDVDAAVKRSTTITQAVDEIERMEGR
jgi:multidrug efflux pump subunit AcrA (membrane-fusion protein)